MLLLLLLFFLIYTRFNIPRNLYEFYIFLRNQIFKFKLRCFNILYYYYNIYNTKKFFIRIVKIMLIYNLQKKFSYIVRQS
jgi:hypothetical protein